MIRRLRWKLTAITMVLLTVVLMVILIFVYQGTRRGLQQESFEALRSAHKELTDIHYRPGSHIRTTTNPCFLLCRMPDGTFVAVGNSMYDLSDREYLEDLFEEAEDTGEGDGVLKDHQLRFLELEGLPGEWYAFMDISGEISTLSRLNFTCFMIFLVGLLVFFGISALVSYWAVRPVEQAWKQQRQFVGDASHELKTPLTVIMTNAELLRDPSYDEESKGQFSENILSMSRQMRGLVEELLDQARIDNGGIQMQSLDMSRLVEDAVLPFEPLYFEANRSLESYIQPGLGVAGSADHLRRVVEILLDNGCKYSNPHTKVVLHLNRQGRNVLLSVTSQGNPLSEQQCEDIFKRFYRVDTARTMNCSYGLGLAIAQGIVEQHRGKIWAENQGEANVFFVSLPLDNSKT